ncbi:MAG: hypothetical protein Q7O66_20390, partial [Dehalococcoidia bacterium]|nr:hypothetical protein [Dehalococcoidia bacterium]
VAACGVLLVTLSYNSSRSGLAFSMPLFFAGVLLLYLPLVARLGNDGVKREEAIGLLLLLGLGLYVVKVLSVPPYYSSFDELLHWRTADDILRTNTLFTENSGLPVSPLFPGLEIATNAVATLGGLGIHEAGVIIVGVARIIIVLSLYLVFEQLTASVRTAALGTAIYMGSSTFVYFDAQYAYESLALPLVVFIIFLLLRRATAVSGQRLTWSSLTALALLAIVTVHHLSSFILLAFLIAWSVVTRLGRHSGVRQPTLVWLTVLLLSWIALWLAAIARSTIGYLTPYALSASSSIQLLLLGRGARRDLAVAGEVGFNYERLLALSSVGLIVMALAFGLWNLRRRHTWQPLSVALALAAMAYPAIPFMRLFDATWQVSNRLAGFVFVPLGFVVAFGLTELVGPGRLLHIRRWLVLAGMATIFFGGLVAGSNPVTRLPGPYVVIADERSVESQGLLAAEWARQILGLNNHMAGDRVQASLMGSYGGQNMVFRLNGGTSLSSIFLTPGLEDKERAAIKLNQIRYVTIDRRISSGPPLIGHYFESWERLVVPTAPAIIGSQLDKFDHAYDASRIYDSGDIRIYDLGATVSGP